MSSCPQYDCHCYCPKSVHQTLAEGEEFSGKVYWPPEEKGQSIPKPTSFFFSPLINGDTGLFYYKFIINAQKNISSPVQPNTWQQVNRGRQKAEGLRD